LNHAGSFLLENKSIWALSKKRYAQQLLFTPPMHGTIFIGDYLNHRSQEQLINYGVQTVSIIPNAISQYLIPAISPVLGIMNYAMDQHTQEFMIRFWRYYIWLGLMILGLIFSVFSFIRSRDQISKKSAIFIFGLTVIFFFNWTPLWLMSATNQARYHYLLYLFSKCTVISIGICLYLKKRFHQNKNAKIP
jgi:cytochrome bd-type quinol oxidase subunit 1